MFLKSQGSITQAKWALKGLVTDCQGPLTWIGPVSAGRVVEYEYGGEVGADGREVLGVRPEVERAVLAVVAPLQDAPVAVQPVRHSRPVDLHARGEHHQLVPLGNLQDTAHSLRARLHYVTQPCDIGHMAV